jgi:hypothetical protein
LEFFEIGDGGMSGTNVAKETRETAARQETSLSDVLRTYNSLVQETSELLASLENASPAGLARVKARLEASLKVVRGETPLAEAGEAPTVPAEQQKLALISKYKIEVLGESQVTLTLPKGTTRADFLTEVQAVAAELYGRNAIYPSRLETWAKDQAFTSKKSKAETTSIDGNVKGSTDKIRSAQETFLKKQGLSMPELENLAVAHAAYFLATGKDLFAGNVVRARGGALRFNDFGVRVSDFVGGGGDDGRYGSVAASAALPSRN